MSAEKKGGSRLAADGLTLAQIGAAVCHATVDAGGNDRMARMILSNSAMRKAIGKAVTTPRWEVTSNAQQVREYIRERESQAYADSEKELFSNFSSSNEKFEITNGVTYRLFGVPLKGQKNVTQVLNENGGSSCQSLTDCYEVPLEVAILMRMQIKPEELGFHWIMMVTFFNINGKTFCPVLFNAGALVHWPIFTDFSNSPPNIGAVVFLER